MQMTPSSFWTVQSEVLGQFFDELGWFAKFSGLEPNVAKANGMWIGIQAFSTETICTEIYLKWMNKIKLLGIIFEPKCLTQWRKKHRCKEGLHFTNYKFVEK